MIAMSECHTNHVTHGGGFVDVSTILHHDSNSFLSSFHNYFNIAILTLTSFSSSCSTQ